MGVKTGKTNALQQIKCVCYVHVCTSLPSPPTHLLQPPSLPALSLSSLSPYIRLVRFLKIVSGRLLSLLSLTLMDTSLVRPLQIVSGKLLS